MDAGDVFERAWELMGRLELVLREHSLRQLEVRTGNERQEFVDRAAITLMPLNRQPGVAYEWAEKLWEERERRRGLPNEREAVVRYLNHFGSAVYSSAADAIKAGKHLEPEPYG